MLLVKLSPSLFYLTKTARQDMKNLDGECRSTGESAVWSEVKMKEIQNPRNLCNMKYLI